MVQQADAAATGSSNRIEVVIDGRSHLLHPDASVVLSNGVVVEATTVAEGLPAGVTVLRVASEDDVLNQATPSTGGGTPAAGDLAQSSSPPPASGSGGDTDADSTDDSTDDSDGARTDDGLNRIPEGAEIWNVDGRVMAVYVMDHPDGGESIHVGWWITDPKQLEAILGDSGRGEDRRISAAEANALGLLDAGVVTEIGFGDPSSAIAGNENSNLLDNFLEDWAEQYSGSPLYADEEIFGLAVMAALEGRAVTDQELKNTAYYQTTTPEERQWLDLVGLERDIDGTSNAEAARLRDTNREMVAAALQSRGWHNPPQAFVNYLADQFTTGKITESQLNRQIIQETDPFAAGASPFAGITDWSTIDPSWRVVSDGENFWVRTQQGDYRLNGPGQAALFGGDFDTISQAPAGQYVTANGQHYLITTGGVLKATGGGQIENLRRLYGEPRQLVGDEASTLEEKVVGSVVDFFGGAGSMESFGDVNEVGVATDLAAQIGPDGRATTALGQEERVRDLLYEWLGPQIAAGYSESWVNQWAGRLRNGGEGEIDMLVQELRGARAAMFPGHDENLTYEQLAAPWRGLWRAKAGQGPSEDADPEWMRILQLNDYHAATQELNRLGLQRGWAPTAQQLIGTMGAALGSQVRGSL